jgi:putative polyhydroxyalkanoate system protein
MPKYELDIAHALAPENVKARLEGATAKIEATYGAHCKWTGEHQLAVTRKGFDALVTIEAARVHVDMNLGFLLIALAPAIKAGLSKELTTLLANG